MNYSKFNTTPDHAYNIRRALEYCAANGETLLEFDNGVYDIYPDTAFEGVYCTSNHGVNGLKRTAFLLKGMKNFTIDANGSEFVMNGTINPIIIDRCENIKIKNLSLSSTETRTMDGEVVEVFDDDSCILKITPPQPILTTNDPCGKPCFIDKENDTFVYRSFIETDANCVKLRNDVGDNWLRPNWTAQILNKENNVYTVLFKTPGYKPLLGNWLVFNGRIRFAANILINRSSNISIENYNAYSGTGMGVIAQKSENISIDHMKTECKPGKHFSLNADATHFVNCKGKISITNSKFSGQLDDALNVHGIYTRITKVDSNKIFVKYMHYEATGIDIYDIGDKVNIVTADSLLPKGTYEVKDIEILNSSTTILTLDRPVDAEVGDDCENITWNPEVEFSNNHVSFNRARGMLLASSKKTIIRNNYFNTSGGSILFESDGNYWFEAGSTKDVLICNNTFDDCRYGKWAKAVIDVLPRKRAEEGRYFHGRIEIADNLFKDCHAAPIALDNVETVSVHGNKVENTPGTSDFTRCKNVECDIPYTLNNNE